MSLNQENIAIEFLGAFGLGIVLPVFLLYRVNLRNNASTKKGEVILINLISLAWMVVNVPALPRTLKRTIVEYQFRYQNGPDPETLFHDQEARANYTPARSKFDSISRALGGGSHTRRRPRGTPTPTSTPSGAASMTVNAVKPIE
jgi:hypothetical protein